MKKILTLILLFTALATLVQGKKLLPAEIKSKKFTMQYTYDSQNRFTSIKILTMGELDRYDTFIYDNEKIEIRHHDENGEYKSECGKFIELSENKYSLLTCKDEEDATGLTIKLNDRKKVIYICSPYDDKDSIIYNFKYDESNNLIDITLPNNVSSEYINPTFQIFTYQKVIYDDKNGIFKNVEPISSFLEFSNPYYLPYMLYLSNNMIDIIDKENEPLPDYSTHVKYNEDDYPTEINGMTITYTEAK